MELKGFNKAQNTLVSPGEIHYQYLQQFAETAQKYL